MVGRRFNWFPMVAPATRKVELPPAWKLLDRVGNDVTCGSHRLITAYQMPHERSVRAETMILGDQALVTICPMRRKVYAVAIEPLNVVGEAYSILERLTS